VKAAALEDPKDKMESGKPTEDVTAWAIPSQLGMHLVPLDDELRRKFGIASNLRGMVITAVDENSAAGESGLMPGDLVMRTLDVEVTSMDQFAQLVAQARQRGLPFLPILVRRGTTQRWIQIGAS